MIFLLVVVSGGPEDVCITLACRVATGWLLSCNWSGKNYMSRVATEVLEELQIEVLVVLQLKCFWGVAIEVLFEELQLKCLSCCNWIACWVAIEVLWRVAIEVLVELQLEHCLSCNSSEKNYKITCPEFATEVLEELQLKFLSCCNWSVVWVAIHLIKIIKNSCPKSQLRCLSSCN
jgi:hypothetical protein